MAERKDLRGFSKQTADYRAPANETAVAQSFRRGVIPERSESIT